MVVRSVVMLPVLVVGMQVGLDGHEHFGGRPRPSWDFVRVHVAAHNLLHRQCTLVAFSLLLLLLLLLLLPSLASGCFR